MVGNLFLMCINCQSHAHLSTYLPCPKTNRVGHYNHDFFIDKFEIQIFPYSFKIIFLLIIWSGWFETWAGKLPLNSVYLAIVGYIKIKAHHYGKLLLWFIFWITLYSRNCTSVSLSMRPSLSLISDRRVPPKNVSDSTFKSYDVFGSACCCCCWCPYRLKKVWTLTTDFSPKGLPFPITNNLFTNTWLQCE